MTTDDRDDIAFSIHLSYEPEEAKRLTDILDAAIKAEAEERERKERREHPEPHPGWMAEDDERVIEPGDAVAYIGFDGDPFIHRWPKGISCPPRKCGYVVLMRAAEVRRKLEGNNEA
jgi:hypothetical protein